MYIYIILILLPDLLFSLSSRECALGAFDSSKCQALCWEIGVGGKWYNITDGSLTIENIEAICPNVAWSREFYFSNGVGCTYDDLVWDSNNCKCPSCPCSYNNGIAVYSTFRNFFEETCVSCICEEVTNGETNYGYNCWQYGETKLLGSSYTTTTSWEQFNCDSNTGPINTCINDGGHKQMAGDGFWLYDACNYTYCYCDDGNRDCRTGWDNILGTDDNLKAAFLDRCGEDIRGCRDTPSNIVSCGNNYDCPQCGCGSYSEFDRWIVSETNFRDDSSTSCLSCICQNITDDNPNKAGLRANCGDDDESFSDDSSKQCPPSTYDGSSSCYYGVSEGDEKQRSIYAPNKGECQRKYGQCGWQTEVNTFEGKIQNNWGCLDSILCKTLGISSATCIHSNGTIKPAYFACGLFVNDGFTYNNYRGCYDGDDSNSADIPTDLDTTCTDNANYNTFHETLFGCLMGDGLTTPFGRPVNYNILKCENRGNVGCQDGSKMAWNEPHSAYTYNVNDYIYYSYGCACKTGKFLYNLADDTTKAIMLTEKDDFIQNMAVFAGQNPSEWYSYLNCNINDIDCDLDTGNILISPKTCNKNSVLLSEYSILACIDDNNIQNIYPLLDHPQFVLSNFEHVKTVCPGVAAAADMDACSQWSDLVWSDDKTICPMCSCDAETTTGFMSSPLINDNWFFTQKCTACKCLSLNNTAGDLGIMCTTYGDYNFDKQGYTTINSWDNYKCPPDPESSVCEDGDRSYLPGQSYWKSDANDTYCLCNTDKSGTSECQTGYAAILGSSSSNLKTQFLRRCGEKLEGCLNSDKYGNIATRADVIESGKENPNCPACGCTTLGTVYTTEEADYNDPSDALKCRTCVCVQGDNDDYNGKYMNCDDNDYYTTSDNKECPPTNGTSCYHGYGTDPLFSSSTKGIGSCPDLEDIYCSWEYSKNAFEEEYKRQCSDRVFCEVFGATSSCITTTVNITMGMGCGVFETIFGSNTITMKNAMQCCNTDNCNNGNIDITQCTESDEYGELLLNLFGCLQGETYLDFSCQDGQYADVTCDNYEKYIRWTKGCACTTAYNIYKIAATNLKTYLEGKIDEFLAKMDGFSGQNIRDWNDYLQCNIDWKCDYDTGTLIVTPTPSPTQQPTQQPTPEPTDEPETEPGAGNAHRIHFIIPILFTTIFAAIYH